MNKILIIVLALFCSYSTYCQQVLLSWSQQNIEGLTKDKYDVAQKTYSQGTASKKPGR